MKRCWVCGTDISGIQPLEGPERTTCWEPEHCIDRLQSVRDAWKLLAHALRRRDKVMRMKALTSLHEYGELELKRSKLPGMRTAR